VLAPGRTRGKYLWMHGGSGRALTDADRREFVMEGKVVIDLLVLDSIRRSRTDSGLGIVCDGFVCGGARRVEHRLCLEDVDAGRCALVLAHLLRGFGEMRHACAVQTMCLSL
jgi:hypothetical protein